MAILNRSDTRCTVNNTPLWKYLPFEKGKWSVIYKGPCAVLLTWALFCAFCVICLMILQSPK